MTLSQLDRPDTVPGHEQVRALFDRVPKNETMTDMVGWRFIDFDGENLRLGFAPKPFFCNPMGMIHGGFVASMLDETMGSALFAATAGKRLGATITATIDYVRPAMLGPLEATGKVRHLGKSIAFVEAELWSDAGKMLAKSSGSFKLIDMALP